MKLSKLFNLFILCASSLLFISACSNDSGGKTNYRSANNQSKRYGINARYPNTSNTYRYNNYDYYKYSNYNKRYPFNWNNYAGSYLSRRGPLNLAYCGVAIKNYATGICYQSCLKRVWTKHVGYYPGQVWGCNNQAAAYGLCGWNNINAYRTWWKYHWLPVQQVAVCY